MDEQEIEHKTNFAPLKFKIPKLAKTNCDSSSSKDSPKPLEFSKSDVPKSEKDISLQKIIPLEIQKSDKNFNSSEILPSDYSQVSVDDYGEALLRGMGWDEDSDNGKLNKNKLVTTRDIIIRPYRLGLGAEPDKNLKSSRKSSYSIASQSDSKITNGAYFVVNDKGPYHGFYGQILEIDRDNKNQIIVKLALKKHEVRISRFSIVIIDDEEYKSKSQTMNMSLGKNHSVYESIHNKSKTKHPTFQHSIHDNSNNGMELSNIKNWVLPGLIDRKDRLIASCRQIQSESNIPDQKPKHLKICDIKERYLSTCIPKQSAISSRLIKIVAHDTLCTNVGKIISIDYQAQNAKIELLDTLQVEVLTLDSICLFSD